MSCLIAGDSIALGVSVFLHGCAVDAQIGIGSAAIIHRVRLADRVIISSGSNDPHNPRLVDNLRASRWHAGDAEVIWIVPAIRTAAEAVRAIGGLRLDRMVTFKPGSDGLHPACPKCVAAEIEGEQ